jgi:hypothetical protein
MSEVTICNLALSHLGDTAEVTSIRPPYGSVQAQHCARFYPAARNALLEMAPWTFATRRTALAQVSNPTENTWTDSNGTKQTNNGTWRFAYALPSDVVSIFGVIPASASDDYQEHFQHGSQGCMPIGRTSSYVPQPFACETQADGSQIILTNCENAVLRYTAIVEDTTQFSPLFTMALSYLLASMLVGPIIKGDSGITVGLQMAKAFNAYKTQAVAADVDHGKTHVEPVASWMRNR